MLNRSELFRSLVNLQFEVAWHELEEWYEDWYDYVKKNPIIDGRDWFTYYTMPYSKEDEVYKKSIKLIRENTTYNKYGAWNAYNWFNLWYWLRNI